MSNRPRDVFPLRFKNPGTRAALKHLAEQNGVSMTEIAELAIEHEIALQGADLERRLAEALAVVRAYQSKRDSADYIAAVGAGERSGLDPFRDVRQAVGRSGGEHEPEPGDDPFGVLAAFER